MRILFDQGTPVGIRQSLSTHNVSTAYELGWNTLLNGELLRVAEEARFDVLVTTDKNLVYQQNIAGRTIAIVVLGQARWALIRPMLKEISEAIDCAKAGSYTFIPRPPDPSHRR
jgi:CRISPR/Cas system endoribonuclease Cas6 (RAMP superfamily)